MSGLTQVSSKELFALLFKLIIVIALISETSWEFFHTHFFAIFTEGMDGLIQQVTAQIAGAIGNVQPAAQTIKISQQIINIPAPPPINLEAGVDSTLSFLDQTLKLLLSENTWIKISALITAPPFGFFYFLIITFSIFYFIYAIFRSFLIYVLAIIMVAVMLVVAPIMIPLLLFGKTKGLFERWWKLTLMYALQPLFLFMALAIFNVFVYSSLILLLNFHVCWSCLIQIEALADAKLQDCLFWGYIPWNVSFGDKPQSNLPHMPVSLFSVFMFMVVTHAMMKFIDFAMSFATSITAGATAPGADLISAAGTAQSELARSARGAVGGVKNAMKTAAYAGDKATGGKISSAVRSKKRKAGDAVNPMQALGREIAKRTHGDPDKEKN